MKNIFIALSLFTTYCAQAQISVGSSDIATSTHDGRIYDEDLALLKNTTTLFVLQNKDYEHIADFEKAISSAWKITKFRIIKPEEIASYSDKEGYSMFCFGGYILTGERIHAVHISYDLLVPRKDRKGRIVEYYYSQIYLMPDFETSRKVMAAASFDKTELDYIYNKGIFTNWGPGYLKGYLSVVNAKLQEGKSRWLYTSEENEDALKILNTDTLFIPDYVNVHFNPLSGAEDVKEKDDDNFSNAYKHPYRVITSEQLEKKILDSEKPIRHLVYVRSSAEKYVTVYDSEKGIIYAKYTPASYNFKSKDLGKINSEIE
jgi:hypothetical protein